MSNPNYVAGRAQEYSSMKQWKERGYSTIRASGSHGQFDVIAFRSDRKPELIQCKLVKTEAQYKALLKLFKETTTPSQFFHQVLETRIKGSKTVLSHTI